MFFKAHLNITNGTALILLSLGIHSHKRSTDTGFILNSALQLSQTQLFRTPYSLEPVRIVIRIFAFRLKF